MLKIWTAPDGKQYRGAGKIDYVAGWYYKSAQMMLGKNVRAALVSTNSITQGEQTALVWKPLMERFGVHIDFAHQTFRWDSEASIKAHVHCVIVGFSTAHTGSDRFLYSADRVQIVSNINAYLLDAFDVFVENRAKPICDVPQMLSGNRPTDGGHLILSAKEKADLVKAEPASEKYIKNFMMGYEFINNVPRYCLWLVGISPKELRQLPKVAERVALCKAAREISPDSGRRRLALTPTLFREQLNPDKAIVIPKVSSERRKYVPMGYLGNDTIAGDKLFIIPDAEIYHFGVLTSNVHMAWMRAVCGRLKSDYSYSINVVYNNFSWPEPTPAQKAKIEQTAQAILDARANHPESSLADLYDDLAMPPDLRKAHQANDWAVMQAYGLPVKGTTEADCVAILMQRYQELTGS